jgi:hypothetical protein
VYREQQTNEEVYGNMGFLMSKHQNNGGASVTAHDRAVLELKIQRDKLTVYKTKVQLLPCGMT